MDSLSASSRLGCWVMTAICKQGVRGSSPLSSTYQGKHHSHEASRRRRARCVPDRFPGPRPARLSLVSLELFPGQLTEGIGDLSLPFVGGVLVDQGSTGAAVSHAGHQLSQAGTGTGRLYRLRIVQLPPSPPGAWWRRCAIGFAEPGSSARSHDRAAIGKTKQSAYSGKSCSPAGSPQLVHPRVSDLGDSLGVGPTLAGARIGNYRCRERADRPLPVVCGGGNLDARPVGRQRNDHRAVP